MAACGCGSRTGGGMVSLTSAIAITGNCLTNSRNHMKNQPKLPSRINQSMNAGEYMVHCHGSNSCDSDGSKIVNRSNHIPRLMNRDMVKSQVGLRRSFWKKNVS